MLYDEMTNSWGTELVVLPSYRKDRGDINRLRELVKNTIAGFALYGVYVSGTDANRTAVELATKSDAGSLLVCLGAYGGGKEIMQELSTSDQTPTATLAFPHRFDREGMTTRCREQSMTLPYWIECKEMTSTERRQHEDKFLAAVHRKLLFRLLKGNPVRAALIELILGGNGGELSSRFLIQLGNLLSNFGVVAIMDECLTGGRVGPNVTLTQDLLLEFRSCVLFVTMAKFMGRGLLLVNAGYKNSNVYFNHVRQRGLSTNIDVSKVCAKFARVNELQLEGAIHIRQEQIKKEFDVNDHELWGRGLLIFVSK